MSTYLGMITIRNRYVNFKPLYEYVNNEFKLLSPYDRQAILPESQYGDINFYSSDNYTYVQDMFVDGEYRLLDLDDSDLEDNFSYGSRNPTGYKIDVSKLSNGKIRELSDIDYYYILSDTDYEGSYRTNTTLEITDPHVYEGLQVVIPIKEVKDTVIGPFTVEWEDKGGEGSLVIRTKLQSQKYILWGYSFPTYISSYALDVGRFGDQRSFLKLDSSICWKVPIDAITKEQLLKSFRDTLSQDCFSDGKIDLSQTADLMRSYEGSLFVGDEIPEDIRDSRFDTLSTLLTDEEALNDTFGFIASSISLLLEKYQDNEQYKNLLKELADDQQFMSNIQSFRIISESIETKRGELRELTAQAEEVQQSIKTKTEQEFASGVASEYEAQIQHLREERESLAQEIKSHQDSLGMIKTLEEIEEQVDYKTRRERELEQSIQSLKNNIDSIFANSTEKAMSFAFDGMLSNRMLQQAAKWESQQNVINYNSKVSALKTLPLSTKSGPELTEYLVNQIKAYRPNYDRNAILNILLCYTQGFLTVFSGEPGTGKTSICKILASTLGLKKPEDLIPVDSDGAISTRFIPVSVERGWTTKRDFIGYYNPLTKSFDRSNRRIFDALNVMDLEAKGNHTDMPFMLLLDEANLSPMEYYWADYMNICDDIDGNGAINLGDNFCFRVPQCMRFVATINNDHTTESLSPRLVDRAWVIRLPKVKSGKAKSLEELKNGDEIISWSALVTTFGSISSDPEMKGEAKEIYEELVNLCRSAKVNVSNRADLAIRKYWIKAQELFDSTDTDASIIALDYAVAQRILPHIDGSGEKYGEHLTDIQEFCSKHNLKISAGILAEIIQSGEDSMHYYQFFA